MIHIGISGPIAVGKSTLANELWKLARSKGLEAAVISFAAGIRELLSMETNKYRRIAMAQKLFNWGFDTEHAGIGASMIDEYMYQYPSQVGVKNRRLLQLIGTEIGREYLGADTWIMRVQQLARQYDALDYLISDDLRFDNEAMAVDVHIAITLPTGKHVGMYHDRRSLLDPAYTFDNHPSERSLTLPALFTIPIGFTDDDVQKLYDNLDNIRKLRI